MAMVMLVISVSPMLAPLAGSGLMLVGELAADLRRCWRSPGLLSLALTGFVLPETLAPANRRAGAAGGAGARASGGCCAIRTFMGLT